MTFANAHYAGRDSSYHLNEVMRWEIRREERIHLKGGVNQKSKKDCSCMWKPFANAYVTLEYGNWAGRKRLYVVVFARLLEEGPS